MAHGGFRGPGAPTGDGLRLVSTCNAVAKFNRKVVVNVKPLMRFLLNVGQHAVDPEPGAGTHRNGGRRDLGFTGIFVSRGVLLHLRLQ